MIYTRERALLACDHHEAYDRQRAPRTGLSTAAIFIAPRCTRPAISSLCLCVTPDLLRSDH